MAEIVAFPPCRRRGYIRRQAAFILSMNAASGEAHLRRQLSLQLGVLTSKGVDPELARRAVADLESALRAELWRAVFQPGGAA